jgi:hypothetical protein
VKKIKRGSGKHKGKIPFTCFNCGRVGYFVYKCSYEKMEDSDNEDNNFKEEHNNNRSKYYRHKRGNYTKKNIFYSREDSSLSHESDGYASNIDIE